TIEDGFIWLTDQLREQNANSDDIAIVHFSGHGVVDKRGDYWFLPANVISKDPENTAVAQGTIERYLRNMKSHVLLFLDTCHAGQSLEQLGLRVQIDATINRLTDAATGGVVLFSSATGSQLAKESGG